MILHLMTWNIHKGIGMDRRFRLGRIVDVIQHHQPEVLLLQEVDRGVPRSRRLHLDEVIAMEAAYPFHCWSATHHLKDGAYGNAILSRLPIRKKRVLDLTIGRRKRRGGLYVRLSLPGHFADLHLFNWHLGLMATERARQVQKVLQSGTLRSLRVHARVILGGDTNDWRNLLYHGAGLKQAGFSAWAEHGRRRLIPTYPSPAPVGALDKFFWRGPVEALRVHASRMQVTKVASDHLPLLAEFRLEP